MLMLTSLEDVAVFRPVAEVLGDKFFFVASPGQVSEAPAGRRPEGRDRQVPQALAREARRPRSELGRPRLGCHDAHRRRVEKAKSTTARKCATRWRRWPTSRARPASIISPRPSTRASPRTRSCSATDHERQGRSGEVTARCRRASWTVEALSARYGQVEALSAVDLFVGEGELVTVLGPNGAGKSTLLRAVMGLVATEGEVRFHGARRAAPQSGRRRRWASSWCRRGAACSPR